jgi:hypothetical protein
VAGRASCREDRLPHVGAGLWNGRHLLRLVCEQQDDERGRSDRRDDLHGSHDAVEGVKHADPQKLGKPELSKNHSALVSHRPTSKENTRPPATGSAQPGMRRDRTASTFTVNAP